jgi:transcriptional regulator with XRE-family HTH domain
MPTFFEQQVRNAVEISGFTYSQLAKQSGVSASQIGRYMSGERGLTSEGLGKILDALGCMLTEPTRRRDTKPIGRPKKPVLRVKLTEEQLQQMAGLVERRGDGEKRR